MALDKVAVAQIAALARIGIGEAELETLASDLSQILTWVERLNEVDTAGVDPMAGPVEMRLAMREDRVSDGDCREAILGNAPRPGSAATDREFFVVPKVVE
jgi:aspartyl-tRNA(Asn)/glutamyl-tRNA(Gln) amidotransferase subunit C